MSIESKLEYISNESDISKLMSVSRTQSKWLVGQQHDQTRLHPVQVHQPVWDKRMGLLLHHSDWRIPRLHGVQPLRPHIGFHCMHSSHCRQSPLESCTESDESERQQWNVHNHHSTRHLGRLSERVVRNFKWLYRSNCDCKQCSISARVQNSYGDVGHCAFVRRQLLGRMLDRHGVQRAGRVRVWHAAQQPPPHLLAVHRDNVEESVELGAPAVHWSRILQLVQAPVERGVVYGLGDPSSDRGHHVDHWRPEYRTPPELAVQRPNNQFCEDVVFASVRLENRSTEQQDSSVRFLSVFVLHFCTLFG